MLFKDRAKSINKKDLYKFRWIYKSMMYNLYNLSEISRFLWVVAVLIFYIHIHIN